jgi:excisionase family DNA binding protein
MPAPRTPLYVRLSEEPSRRLERAVSISGRSKRQIVEEAVRDHLDDAGLVVGRVALREPAAEVLTLEEAAALLRVGASALEAAAGTGGVPGRRIGDAWRFSKASLIAWLGQQAPAPETSDADRDPAARADRVEPRSEQHG